jgi:hypothetical protein
MPKGYIYAELEVIDPALFETYRPLAAASIAAPRTLHLHPSLAAVTQSVAAILRCWRVMVRHRARCYWSSTARNERWSGTTRRNIKPPYRSGCDLPRPRS